MSKIESIISELNLEPLLPEGGYFRQTYRSRETIETLQGLRPASTSIYYLVTRESFSRLHRLKNPELYHFYAGDPLRLTTVSPEGAIEDRILGNRIERGERPQILVPPHYYQGSRLSTEDGEFGFALVGTTMSPGFDFEDFEVADVHALRAILGERFTEVAHLF